MEKQISKESLSDLPKLSTSVYLSKEKTAYKDCSMFYHSIPHLEQRLRFIDSLEYDEGYTKPISILKNSNNVVYGYEMQYLEGYKSVTDFIKSGESSKMDFKLKKYILLKLYQTLKHLNESYYVGDIHGKNVMISPKGESCIIDWENGRPLGTNYSIPSIYYIKELHGSNLSDSVRLFYIAVSLLYDVDLENRFELSSLSSNLDFCKFMPFDDSIKEFSRDVEKIVSKNDDKCIYFDDYLKYTNNISNLKRELTKKSLKKSYYIN